MNTSKAPLQSTGKAIFLYIHHSWQLSVRNWAWNLANLFLNFMNRILRTRQLRSLVFDSRPRETSRMVTGGAVFSTPPKHRSWQTSTAGVFYLRTSRVNSWSFSVTPFKLSRTRVSASRSMTQTSRFIENRRETTKSVLSNFIRNSSFPHYLNLR